MNYSLEAPKVMKVSMMKFGNVILAFVGNGIREIIVTEKNDWELYSHIPH